MRSYNPRRTLAILLITWAIAFTGSMFALAITFRLAQGYDVICTEPNLFIALAEFVGMTVATVFLAWVYCRLFKGDVDG